MTRPNTDRPTQAPVPEQPDGPKPRLPHGKRAVRRRTARFVIVFILSVFVLLGGYQYVQQTTANDWYLLQVARGTTWLLSGVGHSCGLGDAQRHAGKEREVRAKLSAWAKGEAPPRNLTNPDTGPASDTPPRPLTAWEAWRHKALDFRQGITDAKDLVTRLETEAGQGDAGAAKKLDAARNRLMTLKMRDIGPLVSFVLKAGDDTYLAQARRQLAALNSQPPPQTDDAKARLEHAKAEVAKWEQIIRGKAKPDTALPDGANAPPAPPKPKSTRAMAFNFIVVPDCGAIPSMSIFIAAVIGFPALWRKRLLGLVIGLPILFCVNVFRLAFLACVGAWDKGGEIFNFAHHYVWQGIYIVFVVAVWMAWVELIVRRRT